MCKIFSLLSKFHAFEVLKIKDRPPLSFYIHKVSFFSANCFWFNTCYQYFPRIENIDDKFKNVINEIENIQFPSIIRLSKVQLKNMKSLFANEGISSPISHANLETNSNSEINSMGNSSEETKKKIVLMLDSFEDDEKALKDYRSDALYLLNKYDYEQSTRNKAQEMSKLSRLTLEQFLYLLERELEEVSERKAQSLSVLKLDSKEEWSQISSLFKVENSITRDILLKPLNEEKILEFIEFSNKCRLRSHGTRIYTQVSEDIPCKICNDGDYFDEDLIVFCAVIHFIQKCNISVHQKCYGINKVPNDDWVCELCKAFGPSGQFMPCPFCTKKGGAMKSAILTFRTNMFAMSNPGFHSFLQRSWKRRGNNLSNDVYKTKSCPQGLYYDFQETSLQKNDSFSEEKLPSPAKIWVHMSCSLWIPELIYEDKINCSKIKGFEKIQKSRYEIECEECKQKDSGVPVKCYFPTCNSHFHPECARRGNCSLEIREVEKDPFVLYCPCHIPNKLITGFENKENKAKEELTKFAKELTKAYERFSREERIEKETNKKTKDNKVSLRSETNFLRELCFLLKQKAENQFIWEFTLSRNEEKPKAKVFKVLIPRKFYLRSNIPKSDPIWKKLSLKMRTTQNYFKLYRKFILQRKEYQEAEALKQKEMKKRLKETFERQSKVSEDFKLFCVCQKEYREGESMMCCEKCEEWYHFKCIGYHGTLEEAEAIEYVCVNCEKNEPEDFRNQRRIRFGQFFTQPNPSQPPITNYFKPFPAPSSHSESMEIDEEALEEFLKGLEEEGDPIKKLKLE